MCQDGVVDANSVPDSTEPHNGGSSVLKMKHVNYSFHIVETAFDSNLRCCAGIWNRA